MTYAVVWAPRSPSHFNELACFLGAEVSYGETAESVFDPDIELGGPEWTQPWASGLQDFIDGARDHIDVFTYHNYATGDSDAPYSELFSRAEGMDGGAERVRSALDSAGLNDVPVWLTEHNVYWAWDLDTRRVMRSIQGAVFHALLLKTMATSGAADATMLWNDRDGTYGAMGGDYDIRPVGRLLHLKHTFLEGSLLEAESASNDVVEALAVDGPRGHAVLLINRTAVRQNVSVGMEGWSPQSSTYDVYSITDGGYDAGDQEPVGESQEMELEPYELRLLVFDPETAQASPDVPADGESILIGAYPNPATSTATVVVRSSDSSRQARVAIFDLLGRERQVLLDGYLGANGPRALTFSTQPLAAGRYFVSLESAGVVTVVPLVVVR